MTGDGEGDVVPTNARRHHRIGTGGPWGTGLLVLGVAALAQGAGYMLSSKSSLPPALDLLGPIGVWGALWVAAGIWSVWQALTPPQRNRDVWPMVGVLTLWAGAYFSYWLIVGIFDGEWTRSWTAAVAWGSLAGLVISLGRCVNPPTRVGPV